jgi:hypothetical protein
MGCKFKYNGQTYESEADLKAVLRQELKANTAKVRDGDLLTHPVTKIVSGAQTGVDMAGLDAAQEVNIPTGGTAAAKWQQSTEGDRKIFNPALATKYGLKEGKITKRTAQDGRSYDDVYYQRTLDNAQEADGTIWFGNAKSPGGKLTLGRDAQRGKPSPLINPTSAQEIRNWLNENNIKTLNVAGNREHTNPGIYNKSKTLLVEALKQTTTYSKLGTKTVSGNVVVKNVYQQEGVQYAKSIGGIFSLRINNSNTHFGNPFSPVQAEVDKGLIAAKSTKEAVENYIDWLTTEKYDYYHPLRMMDNDNFSDFYNKVKEQGNHNDKNEQERYANSVLYDMYERKKWILAQLKSGNLKGKPIVYYKELGEPSHATALDYLINKYDWNTQPTTNTTTQLSEYESERVRKYYTSVLQEYKNQVAYLESDTPVKLHELRTKILDENFDRWRNSGKSTYVSHNFELLEKIKSDTKLDRKTVSEFEKLYSADLKINQKNHALNSANLDLFLNLPKNLKDQIRNSGINLDVPIGERVSRKKYLEAISKIESYLSSQQSTTTQQPVVDEITIQKMAEIMKEIYPEAVTDQSQSVTTDDKFMAAKMVVDFANGTVDTLPVTYASLYIAWFRNTPLVQAGIKAYGGSEEALVQAIGEQAVVQKGKAWTWWKKFLAWLLNSANELSDLSKTELRNILTDAFLSRQDITATVGRDVYKKDRTSGEWVGVDPDNPIVYPSDAAFKAALDAEQATKVKNDAMIKPAWKNNKRAALENRLLNIHKAIALHPVNAQNLLAPVSTVITKGIVKKLGIRAKHETRGAVIDPLSNINASIAMVQGKQGVGIVANAINTKAALTGVDAKLTSMYPVQSPLSTDEKHTQLPINLRMLGIEKVRYADGTLAYSLGKLVDTFGNSIISNLSESLTQQVDNVKDPVAVELGYTLKTLGLTSYILTLGVPQEILAGLTAKGGIVTAWNDRVEENENLFHKGVVEQYSEFNDYAGEWRESTIRFEESNSTLKVEFIAALLRKEGVPSKYIETVVDENRKVKGYLLKHEALDADNVSLDKYDAVKLLFYWELIDQARAYGNTIKALTADTKTHKSIDAAAQQQLLIDQQLAGIDSIIDKDDISKVISSRTALKSNTKSVISPFFNMQRKYIEYFSKYFYTHDNGISSYLAANLKARYKLYNGDKLNRLISTAHNDFMIYLMTRMTAVNPNATSSLAKYNIDTAPLVEANALLKHGEGLKMSAVNSIYNNLVLISKQPNLTTSQNYYYAQPASARKNSIIELYQNITPEMARSLLDIFRFELGRVIKADVNVDNNTSIYLQNIPSVDLIMFKDSAITTSAANNYIEIFEELRTLSPKLIQLFNSISLFQAGLNNSPYNLFKTLPITDLLSEDRSKSLVSNLATTIRTFDKLLPKKGVAHSAEADKRSDAIYNMVDDFLRWFDLQYGKIYVQPEAASKYNKASRLYKAFSSKDQKFIIYVKNDEGGGTPLTSVSSLTKNYLSTVPYTYAPTTTAVTNSNVITNDTINEDATIKQLESLGAFGDIIKAYVAAGGEIETLCS